MKLGMEEYMDAAEECGIPAEAAKAYADNMHNQVDADTVDELEEAYQGEWDSVREFAYELAIDTGALTEASFSTWPTSCIDWEHAARELRHDYWFEETSGGVYVFRNL